MAKAKSMTGGKVRSRSPNSWLITPGTAEEVERAELLYVPGHPPALFLAKPPRERLKMTGRILACVVVKQLREERRAEALSAEAGMPVTPPARTRRLGPRVGRQAPPTPRLQRLPDWVTTKELGRIFGWPEDTFQTAVAYGHLLGAVLRDDGQLEVARDAMHAWLRLDWYEGERKRASRPIPEPSKRRTKPTTADGRGLRDALRQTIEAGASAEALLSELERAQTDGPRMDPAVRGDLLRRTDALVARLRAPLPKPER